MTCFYTDTEIDPEMLLAHFANPAPARKRAVFTHNDVQLHICGV
jgi:hypothetical protein